MKKLSNVFTCLSLFLSTLLIVGCGKNERAGAALGAMSGGVLGAIASNRPEGAAIGATIGGLLGGSLGAKDDRRQEGAMQPRKVVELEKEAFEFRRASLEKWCSTCTTKIMILDARTCPMCGDDLVSKKLCSRCGSSFKPNVSFRYCPYCRGGVLLTNL